jgi:hypothetical protein
MAEPVERVIEDGRDGLSAPVRGAGFAEVSVGEHAEQQCAVVG